MTTGLQKANGGFQAHVPQTAGQTKAHGHGAGVPQ